MSFYNMINGVDPAVFMILPMLGKHPDEYPRFRDCFAQRKHFEIRDGLPTMVGENPLEDPVICVFTRVGGGNREDYKEEIDMLRATPGYIEDFDDDFDCTFATFIFKVPDQWLEDYKKIVSGDMAEILTVSDEYKKEMYRVFPKLKKTFDNIFKED